MTPEHTEVAQELLKTFLAQAKASLHDSIHLHNWVDKNTPKEVFDALEAILKKRGFLELQRWLGTDGYNLAAYGNPFAAKNRRKLLRRYAAQIHASGLCGLLAGRSTIKVTIAVQTLPPNTEATLRQNLVSKGWRVHTYAQGRSVISVELQRSQSAKT